VRGLLTISDGKTLLMWLLETIARPHNTYLFYDLQIEAWSGIQGAHRISLLSVVMTFGDLF
jgi:hypothetical protein